VRPRTITLTIVFAVALTGLFGADLGTSSGQQRVRMAGCACFVCGELHVQASRRGVNLPFNYMSLGDPNCEAGILAESACPEVLGTMPRDKVEAFCQKIKAGLKFNSFKDSCPVLAKACEPEDKGPCEKPVPWTDTSSRRCQNMQDTQITIDQKTATATVSMCGYTVLTQHSKDFVDADKPLARAYFKLSLPNKVCCDEFQEAVRTGKPCDPRVDVDCDGKPNSSDSDGEFPDFNNFTRPEGASIDRGFSGFDENPNFVPSPSDCECKWELVKGKVDCSPDGKGRDFYRATWRCPSNGVTRETRKERTAVKSWPCGQP
jgi:hypothetical protein